MENDDSLQLQIYVEIVDSEPAIWRRLQVPGQITLEMLHLILQTVMGWHDHQPYHFKHQVTSGLPLASILVANNPVLYYLYDPADGWLHRIQLEQQLPGDAIAPVCLGGEMACPPESCGGIWGYEDLLERLGDPEDPEYVDLWDRIGGDFDPRFFDLRATNQRLARLSLPHEGHRP